MLSAKSQEMDKVGALMIGADDYLTKPFNMLELKARIKSVFRRSDSSLQNVNADIITVKTMSVNLTNRSVNCNGEEVNLTAKEFDLLKLFIQNPGKVFEREALLEIIWRYDYLGDLRTVDVLIRRLREKIETDPARPEYILTKWGVGYYFTAR